MLDFLGGIEVFHELHREYKDDRDFNLFNEDR